MLWVRPDENVVRSVACVGWGVWGGGWGVGGGGFFVLGRITIAKAWSGKRSRHPYRSGNLTFSADQKERPSLCARQSSSVSARTAWARSDGDPGRPEFYSRGLSPADTSPRIPADIAAWAATGSAARSGWGVQAAEVVLPDRRASRPLMNAGGGPRFGKIRMLARRSRIRN